MVLISKKWQKMTDKELKTEEEKLYNAACEATETNDVLKKHAAWKAITILMFERFITTPLRPFPKNYLKAIED